MAAEKGNKYAVGSNKTEYMPEYDERVFKYCLLGLTDAQIAPLFDVTETTINNWKIANPSFFESMRRGKEDADAEVAASLYKRATGYEQENVKIFQFQGVKVIVPFTEIVAPDVTAQRLWLSNRQRKNWKGDSLDVTSGGEKVKTIDLSMLSSEAIEKALELQQMLKKNPETES